MPPNKEGLVFDQPHNRICLPVVRDKPTQSMGKDLLLLPAGRCTAQRAQAGSADAKHCGDREGED